MRKAFDEALINQTSKAEQTVAQAANKIEDPALRGWLMEQQAAYAHFTDPHRAQQILITAASLNREVLRPTAGIAAAKTRPGAVQAREAASYLAATYNDPTQLVLGVKAMLEDIVFDPDRVPQAEAAWQQLGRHLGFASSRPDKATGGEGPDSLWILARDRIAIIELKTGVTTDTISKHDLNQLGGSVRWSRSNYPDADPLPVMLHPSNTRHALGTPSRVCESSLRSASPP